MAIEYLIHRLTTYPLSEAARTLELQKVTHILQDNGYYNQQLNTIKNKMANEGPPPPKKKNNINSIVNSERNWALFTHSHRKVKTITKLSKQSNIPTVFKMNNTKGTKLNMRPKLNFYHNSGIYQMQCQTCFVNT
jgi:hypothetical protein